MRLRACLSEISPSQPPSPKGDTSLITASLREGRDAVDRLPPVAGPILSQTEAFERVRHIPKKWNRRRSEICRSLVRWVREARLGHRPGRATRSPYPRSDPSALRW